MSNKPVYNSWRSVIARCNNVKSTGYQRYGGRGICVCGRWNSSFLAFLTDMGEKPSTSHSIDRINNDGHYSCGYCEECIENGWPMNCRWATRKEQSSNLRTNRLLTFNNEIKPLPIWANEFGLRTKTLRHRLDVDGMTINEALTRPIDKSWYFTTKKILVCNLQNGIFYFSVREAAHSVPIDESTLNKMISGKRINKTHFIKA